MPVPSGYLRRHAVLLVSACIAMALAVNVFAPFWTAFTRNGHERPRVEHSSAPNDGPTFPNQMGSVAYVVVDSSFAPQPATDTYLDALVKRLRSGAPAGVRSVVSQSSDPLTASIANSDDDRVAFIDVELNGAPGSAEAGSTVNALLTTVNAVPKPPGVHVYVSGPGAAAAAAAALVDAQAPWVALIVSVAMALLVVAHARCRATSAMVLASAAVALLIALPVYALLSAPVAWPIGAALTVALTFGSALLCASLIRSDYRRRRGGGLPPDVAAAAACKSQAPAVVGSASILVIGLIAVTIIGSPDLAAVSISAAIGAAAGTLLCYMYAAAWLPHTAVRPRNRPALRLARLLAQRLTATVYRLPKAALAVSAVVVVAGMAQLPRIDAALARPQIAPLNSAAARAYAVASEHFADDRLQPLSVVLRTDHDLRTPAGLLAIDRVTRRLTELPAASRVQSAAWPGGVPWPQATVAYQIGELNRQLQSEGVSAMPLTDSLSRLPGTLDELTSTIDEFGGQLNAGTAGLPTISASMTDLRSALGRIQARMSGLAEYADPIRRMIATNPNCAADPVCSSAQQVIQTLDDMLADTRSIVSDTQTLPDSVSAAERALTSASSTLSRIRNDLAQFRSVVDQVSKTTRGALPQASKTSSFIDIMTSDLSNSGSGGFYLPQSQIDGADYGRVRARMFTGDGRATRILVYTSRIDPTDRDLRTSAAAAVRQSIKFGDLAGANAEIENLDPPAPMWGHRINDLAAPIILLAAVISLTAGLALGGALVGAGLAGATLASVSAGIGAAAAFASILPGRTDWSTPLLALAVALPVCAEDGFWIARRWISSRRGPETTCALSGYTGGSALTVAVAIWAATVITIAALTDAGLNYVGVAVLCCLAVSYVLLRSLLIAGVALR
jgi:putative drug exporter of the RND superfamily